MEENGGGDGNSSVAELEVRVETLEGTAADHETRISSAESDINGKSFLFREESYPLHQKFFFFFNVNFPVLTLTTLDLEDIISDHETRLTAAEENIQGTYETKLNLDMLK